MERDPAIARDIIQRLEAIHVVTYFAPEAVSALADAGYRGFWMGYFAGRAAPLGAVGPEVVSALFYNFTSSRVSRAIPDAWSFAPPSAALDARRTGAVAALRRAIGDSADGEDLVEAARLASKSGARAPRSTGERCSPPTVRCPGRTIQSPSSGTPARCCGNTAGTVTSPPCSPPASAAAKRTCCTPPPGASGARC